MLETDASKCHSNAMIYDNRHAGYAVLDIQLDTRSSIDTCSSIHDMP